MKTFSHLLKWELFEHRTFLLMALALGFLPYLLAPLISSAQADPGDARLILARVVTLGFFLGAPLAFGTRWLMSALGNGRRAFELARPLSAWQLCGSKFVAILLLLVVGTLLVGAPTLFAAFDLNDVFSRLARSNHFSTFNAASWDFYGETVTTFRDAPEMRASAQRLFIPSSTSFLLVGGLVLLALQSALVLMTFSQSLTFAVKNPRVRSLLDLGSWLAFFGLTGIAAYRLALFGVQIASWTPSILLAVAVLGFFSAWRSWKAGSLLDEAHRQHSRALNPGLLAIGAVTAIAAHLVTVPSPQKLATFSLALPSPDGSHWLVAGPQGNLEPAFVVELASGRTSYVEPVHHFFGLPMFSTDGKNLDYHLPDRRAIRAGWQNGKLQKEELGVSRLAAWSELPKTRQGLNLHGGLRFHPEGLLTGDTSPALFRWNLVGVQGEKLASVDLLPRARPVGEIRPGLLLVGIPSSDGMPRTFRSTPDLLLGKIDNWQTLVIEVPTGKILKKLEGLVPMSHPQTGKQVWLIDKNGEPFDLASAEADPQPILPFRPKLAGI